MSFSINTNITSLQAQNYLNKSAAFQSQTINEVTSGLRIVNSGDDAAGLAVANGLQSQQAVLTQGIQNANNGLATLQTIDGGINNITNLLDRASTLAAQSASGTFTGSRDTLNSEFQSVVSEISQEAQSIGLDTGGTFTKALSVFVGGGVAGKGASAVANGSVGIDLSKSAVDAESLGLNGTVATGAAGSDISNGGANTVTNIIQNLANSVPLSATPDATTSFVFTGAGFSDSNSADLTVSLAGVTDTKSLVTAINNAITLATTTSSGASTGTAFANAGITASLNTDSAGKQQLTFSSGTAAFQVRAGDQLSNALLGNFDVGAANSSTGQSLASTTTGGATTAAAIAGAVVLRVQGSGVGSTPLDITFAAGQTVTQDVTALTTAGSTDANALLAAGITVSQSASLSPLVFTSATGGSVNVSTVGDTKNDLGFGTFINTQAVAGASAFNATTVTAGADLAATDAAPGNGQQIQISVAGGNPITIDSGVTTGVAATDAGTITTNLNAGIQANATLQAAGLVASFTAGGALQITSGNGTAFRVNATTTGSTAGVPAGAASDIGFGTGSAAAITGSTANTLVTNSRVDSAGASSTNTFVFNPTADQTISFSANDASGAAHTTSIDLKNQTASGATLNAQTIDQAVASINSQLQGSGDATLQQIVAVKDVIVGGTAANPVDTEGIKFISSLSTFNVSLGATGTAGSAQGVGDVFDQSTTSVSSTGSQADISTQAGGAIAVGLLSTAVAILGVAQAAVGKGENDLNYAVALATSQNTNEAAAESNIKDADLAREAANLSKAQILVQAGTAALAQANSAPQAILSLLK